MKKSFLITVKYIVMIFFIFLIVKQVHWYDYSIIENGVIVNKSGIISNIKQVNGFILICALLLTLISYCLVGYRWKQLLRIIDIPIQTKEAVKLTFHRQLYWSISSRDSWGRCIKSISIFYYNLKKN